VSTSSQASESQANSLLAAITSAFGMVLGEEEINEETNFFLAGGHSLLALQVIGQIREEQRLEIGLLDLFEAPTPRLLATRLIQRHSNSKRA
jgi:acyl carrier protein